MPRTIRFRPRAEADLDGIWDYTAETWSERQAIAYLEGLRAALSMLAEFPETARLRQEFTPPVRVYTYREHVVIFTTEETALTVVRVLHSRANWREMLSG